MDVPNLWAVSSGCSAYMPPQSAKFFGQGNLTFLHINARSLHQNHSDIVTLLHKENHNADFVLISETWLHPSLISSYTIDGYELFNSIPDECINGKGCAIYVKKSYHPFCKTLDNICINQIEFQTIFLLVSVPGSAAFIVGATYRSPSYPTKRFLDYVEDTLGQISSLRKPCFWGGDWNINLFKYNDDIEPKIFLDCFNSFGFYPTITVPTRVGNTPPFSETLIDNIITNALNTIMVSGSTCAGIADHQTIFCSSSVVKDRGLKSGCHPLPKSKLNYDRIEELKISIKNSIAGFQSICDPEEAATKLSTVISMEAAKFTVPYTSRRCSPIQPWMTTGLLKSINIRNKLLRQFLKFRSAENQNKFRKYRNTLRLAIRHAKKSYYQSQFEKNCQNPKRLWADLLEAVHGKAHQHDMPDSFEVGGGEVKDPAIISDLFNKYYGQVAPSLDSSLGPSDKDPLSYMDHIYIPDVMTFRPVTANHVSNVVSTLKDASAGLDDLSTKLVKTILPIILPELTYLVNLCITQNTFPDIYKTAIITPVFKAGSRKQFANYRPISVLTIFSKVLETIMYQQLLFFISDNNIIYENQFCFRSKHSTYMPIALLYDFITTSLAKGQVSACIYLDLARAFDTVNLSILLKKLTKYGIAGNSLNFLSSYLSNRKHKLRYKGITSGPQDVTCGVPQGSVLGPLLFLLYINDLPSACPQAKSLLFADDTALLYSAPNINEIQSIISMSFPRVAEWLHANRLSLSISKTYYQVYSHESISNNLAITVNETYVKRALTIKYLGVLIDEDLKFKSHIAKVSSTISRNLGIISRARYLLEKKQLILLYNALILPYITYCLVIWGSNYESTLQPIIILQKRAIRLIAGAGRISHTSPLFRELRILKVVDLLHHQLLLILHDFLMGQLPHPIAKRFSIYRPTRNTRTSQHFSELVRTGSDEILPNYRHVNYILFNLFYQAPRAWNRTIAPRIPNLCDIPVSKSLFKKCLRLILLEQNQ